MALERTYNIPLRRRIIYVPDYMRVKKSVRVVKEFLIKHMKGTEVKLGKYLNNALWSKGLRNPLHHIKVTAVKGEDNIIRAELFGKKYDEPTKDEMEKADEQKEEKKKKERKEAKQEKPAKEEKNKEKPEASAKQTGEKKEKPAIKKEVKESEKSEKSKLKPAKSAEHKK